MDDYILSNRWGDVFAVFVHLFVRLLNMCPGTESFNLITYINGHRGFDIMFDAVSRFLTVMKGNNLKVNKKRDKFGLSCSKLRTALVS